MALGWSVVAAVAVSLLLVVTVLSASLLLMLLWYVLRWIAIPVALVRRLIAVTVTR